MPNAGLRLHERMQHTLFTHTGSRNQPKPSAFSHGGGGRGAVNEACAKHPLRSIRRFLGISSAYVCSGVCPTACPTVLVVVSAHRGAGHTCCSQRKTCEAGRARERRRSATARWSASAFTSSTVSSTRSSRRYSGHRLHHLTAPPRNTPIVCGSGRLGVTRAMRREIWIAL
jgi:hypothetical protein